MSVYLLFVNPNVKHSPATHKHFVELCLYLMMTLFLFHAVKIRSFSVQTGVDTSTTLESKSRATGCSGVIGYLVAFTFFLPLKSRGESSGSTKTSVRHLQTAKKLVWFGHVTMPYRRQSCRSPWTKVEVVVSKGNIGLETSRSVGNIKSARCSNLIKGAQDRPQ